MIDHDKQEFCKDCVMLCNKIVEMKMSKVYNIPICTFCGNASATMSWNDIHKHHLDIEDKQKRLVKQLVTWM